jgi:hypothetical protein
MVVSKATPMAASSTAAPRLIPLATLSAASMARKTTLIARLMRTAWIEKLTEKPAMEKEKLPVGSMLPTGLALA